jgi:hypothetical protein
MGPGVEMDAFSSFSFVVSLSPLSPFIFYLFSVPETSAKMSQPKRITLPAIKYDVDSVEEAEKKKKKKKKKNTTTVKQASNEVKKESLEEDEELQFLFAVPPQFKPKANRKPNASALISGKCVLVYFSNYIFLYFFCIYSF